MIKFTLFKAEEGKNHRHGTKQRRASLVTEVIVIDQIEKYLSSEDEHLMCFELFHPFLFPPEIDTQIAVITTNGKTRMNTNVVTLLFD